MGVEGGNFSSLDFNDVQPERDLPFEVKPGTPLAKIADEIDYGLVERLADSFRATGSYEAALAQPPADHPVRLVRVTTAFNPAPAKPPEPAKKK